jgi:hypothetical protein
MMALKKRCKDIVSYLRIWFVVRAPVERDDEETVALEDKVNLHVWVHGDEHFKVAFAWERKQTLTRGGVRVIHNVLI